MGRKCRYIMKYKKEKCYLRNNSNSDLNGRSMINLPEKIWKKMGWDINEHITVTALNKRIIIEREQ